MTKLKDVFGVSKDQILSYLERESVDGSLKIALNTDKQVIVYGSSKQGKTALVEKHVPYKNNIVVRCTPKSGLADIYKSILRECGIQVISERESTKGTEAAVTVGAKFKAILPFLGGGEADLSTQMKGNNITKIKSNDIEFNLELPQDIHELLKKVNMDKFVIMENFHYLSSETQQEFAFDLRTFQELGVRFIILGVWCEKNRLAQFNGDLLDRIIEVPVEPWLHDDFRKVLQKGSNELNIIFSDEIIEEILGSSFDSIGVVQELAKLVCMNSGVQEKKGSKITISDSSNFKKAVEQKVGDYSSRHIRSLENIAEGRKANKHKGDYVPLYLPYYLVRSLLDFSFEDIVSGIRREKLEVKIKSFHHRSDDVRPGDMSNLLHGFAELQSEKGIVPPILDYDRTTRTMRVIDSTFYFFLKYADCGKIAEELMNPLESRSDTRMIV